MKKNEDFLSQKSETKETTPKKPIKKTTVVATDKIETVEAEEIPPVQIVKFENVEESLTKNNVTKAVIAAMREEFLPLEILGVQDKEGYKLVDEKRKMVKKARGLAVEICTKARAESVAYQKFVIGKQKEVTDELSDIEKQLEAKLEVIDKEKERLVAEEETRKQIRLQERVAKLLSLGMVLTGDNYILGGHMINVIQLKIYDEFTFEAAVAPVEADYQILQAKKIEEEAAFKKLQEDQALEREKLDTEKRELEEKVRKQIADQEAHAKAVAEHNAKVETEKKAAVENILKSRKSALFSLGFSQQGEGLLFKELSVTEQSLGELRDDEWPNFIDDLTAKVSIIKVRVEEERVKRENQLIAEAKENERKKIEAETAAKAKVEADEKRKTEEAKALAPDIEKYNSFIQSITELKVPEFSTEAYQKFAQDELKVTLTKMVNYFNKQKPK